MTGCDLRRQLAFFELGVNPEFSTALTPDFHGVNAEISTALTPPDLGVNAEFRCPRKVINV